MSAPKLTAKLRIKNGVPFAIETLSGKTYRCGVCGKIFYDRKKLNKHLENEKPVSEKKFHFPEFDRNVSINVIYTQDIRDLTNPNYPRLTIGDELFKID